jgi:hypothetical protein
VRRSLGSSADRVGIPRDNWWTLPVSGMMIGPARDSDPAGGDLEEVRV